MENIKFTIIIICWNNKKFLEDCLNSVKEQVYKKYEVILSDNNSNDGSVEFVKKNYKFVKIIENGKNYGFAEGNNIAMRQAVKKNDTDYIFILNPDTVMDKYCLKFLAESIENNDDFKVGCYVPKLKVLGKENKISAAGGDCILRCGDNLSRAFYYDDDGSYDEERLVFGPSGAAAVYSLDMIKKIGFYDKHLFTYYEDVDYNIRMQRMTWKAKYVPKSLVYHFHSGTLDDFNPFKTYLLNRNKLYVILKNYPAILFKKYFKDIIRSFGAFTLYCFRNNYKFIWLKIIFFQIYSLPIILYRRLEMNFQLKKKEKKDVLESIDRIYYYIEEHEELMSSEKRLLAVQEYLNDIKNRDI